MSFKEALDLRVVKIEEILAKYLPKEEGFQKTVLSAMNYSVEAGGKRLRPMFMEESYNLFSQKYGDDCESREVLHAFMSALEMIHTYSLVHDDLPAMDNDEYRRGKKTTHVVYGEAMAILAGDALLNYAYETAVKSIRDAKDAKRVGEALIVLSRKAGIYGMVGGQTVDVEAEKRNEELSEEQLLYIHENKTSALIQSALMVGAILGGAKASEIEIMEQMGYDIGIAFQIQDDILDITSSLEELGKPIGSDEKNNKATYVTLKGLKQAKQDVVTISEHALLLLQQLPGNTIFMKDLIVSLINRRK